MSTEQIVVIGVASAMTLFMAVLGGVAFLTRDRK